MGLVGARRNNEWAGRRDLTVNLSPRFNRRSSLNWNCGSDEKHVDDGAQGNNKKIDQVSSTNPHLICNCSEDIIDKRRMYS